jgi:hypothetical protein
MNKGIQDKRIGSEAKLESLGVKGLGRGKRMKLGASLESKWEGVKVRRDREATHTGKE